LRKEVIEEKDSGAEAHIILRLCGTTEQLAEKVLIQGEILPRRLKPDSFCAGYWHS
jgi:hypothetical protein